MTKEIRKPNNQEPNNRSGRVPRYSRSSSFGLYSSFVIRRSLFVLFCSLIYSVNAADNPVSYYHDLMPIFKRSCTGCHHPGKLKGELDLTAFAAFQKGGKHGPAFKAGEPSASRVVEEVSGNEPSMPKEGDPLSKAEIAMIERWIREGAPNDT